MVYVTVTCPSVYHSQLSSINRRNPTGLGDWLKKGAPSLVFKSRLREL